MKTIRKKLRSDRGSSMVLALFLMLVALMVSHTILAAAATAGQNVVQQRESQQAYLTVSSAAETFRDSVLSFNGDNSFRRIVSTKYKDASMEEVLTTQTTYTTLSGPFSKEVENGLKHLMDFGTAYTKTCTIQVEGYEDVSVEMTLDKDPDFSEGKYVLTAVFSNAVPGKPIPEAPCRMKVTIRANTDSVKDEAGQDENNVWTRQTVTWAFTTAKLERADTAKKGAGS